MQNCQNLATKSELSQYVRKDELRANATQLENLINTLFNLFGGLKMQVDGLGGKDELPGLIASILTAITLIQQSIDSLKLGIELIGMELRKLSAYTKEALANLWKAIEKISSDLVVIAGKVANLFSQVDELRVKIAVLEDYVYVLEGRISEAKSLANEAIKEANKSVELANKAIKDSNIAVKKANQAIEGVNALVDQLNEAINLINANTNKINEINKNTDVRIKKLEDNIDYQKIRKEIEQSRKDINIVNAQIAETNAEIKKTNLEIEITKNNQKILEKGLQTQFDLQSVTRKQLDYQNKKTEALAQTQIVSSEKVSQVEQQQTVNNRAVAGGASAAAKVEREITAKLEKSLSKFSSQNAKLLQGMQKDATELEKKLDTKNLGRLSDLDLKTKELTLEMEANYQSLLSELGLQKTASDEDKKRLELKIEKTENQIQDLQEQDRENKKLIQSLSSDISQGLARIKALENKPEISEKERAELANIRASIGENKSKIEALKTSRDALAGEIGTLKEDLKDQKKELQTTITQTDQKVTAAVGAVQGQIAQTDQKVTAAVGAVQGQIAQTGQKTAAQVGTIQGQITNIQTQQGATEVSIKGDIAKIGGTVGAIAVGVATIQNQTSLPNLASAAATGACQTLKNSSCTTTLGRNLAGEVNNGTKKLLDKLGIPALMTQLGAMQAQLLVMAGNIANILAIVTNTWNFLGDKFSKLFSFLGQSRLWGVLNFVLNLHNATMLSRELGVTLIETTNNVLQAIGIKDPEGNQVDIGAILGGQVNTFMSGLVGAENWAGTKLAWAKANRILTAATQLKDNLMGLGNVVQETQEIIGSWVAKIGNGLKEDGLIADSNYDWMDETPQFKNHFGRFNETIENLTNATESINQLASQVIETQELTSEINSNWNTLKTELNTKKDQKTTEEQTKNEESSVVVAIDKTDLSEGIQEAN